MAFQLGREGEREKAAARSEKEIPLCFVYILPGEEEAASWRKSL